ncbi:ribosomal RNA small subunit methyltransferase A [Candidatus Uhrbacteria bacterium]|nr:ribosomal RNA small subunit methyltransferase A [Candidatus Uhrbacteria bacterium]
MKLQEIKAILTEFGSGANKALGQHFLIDPQALEAIVGAAQVHVGDRILEIGPGLGVLSFALKNAGAEVLAIEQDRRFIPRLQVQGIQVMHGDAASLDWDEIIGNESWKFVSNLPYSITSLAIRKALYRAHPPERLVVLIQKEVAERILARGGKHSLVSLMVSFASSSIRIVKLVKPGSFFPSPKVQSAILEIIPLSSVERFEKWGVDPEHIMKIAKVGFAHPRKKVRSNLITFSFTDGDFTEAGIAEHARAEELKPEQWAKLVQIFLQKKTR